MDPSLAISLHFSLEFVGVAALGGLAAWAIQTRPRARAALLAGLLVLQITVAGQFVDTAGVARGVEWATALGSLAAAIVLFPSADRWLWVAGWTVFAGGRVVLSAADAGTSLGRTGTPQIALRALIAVGSVALGVWAWRRTVASVRLRIVAAFVLVLSVVVLTAGGPLASVAGARIRDEQLRNLRTQAEAQQTVFRNSSAQVGARVPVVATAVAGALEVGRDDPAAAARNAAVAIHREVFTDLAFIAVFAPDRTLLGSSSDPVGDQAQPGTVTEAEAVVISGSAAVTEALRGDQAVPSVDRVADALLAIGAAPAWRPNRSETPEHLVAVVVLGRRLDAATLSEMAESTGLAVALVSPSRGEVIASSDGRLAGVDLPARALTDVADRAIWTGAVESGERRFFAAAAPLAREDGSVPAALVLASRDTVLAATTVGVSRTLFAAVLAATLAAVLIALVLARRISGPLIELTGVARRVEEGDLDATARLHRSDEIGTLAGAFDSMTASLRRTIATEKDTRSRLETIVGGMGEALVAVDADFDIVQFNPAAEAITGVSAPDALGRKCHEVYGHLTRGRDGKPICDYLCPLRHGGGNDPAVSFDPGGGRPVALAVSCSTLRDADGNVVGGVDLMHDVSAEVEAERMKSNFLANISHELRTPLTPIRGYAEILRRRELPREEQSRYLSEIVDSTERLERIIKILVDVAAMEAGHLPMLPVPADPSTLLDEAVQRWSGRTTKHRIQAKAAAALPPVMADTGLIGRVLDELVDNAVKFSPDGGPIVLDAELVRGGVSISVTDRGIGVPKQDLQGLFQEFTQVDPSETRQFGGLGVGLAFVRRVVEGHGGTLDVRSRPGRGSTFSFVLPRQPRRRSRTATMRSKPSTKARRTSQPESATARSRAAKRPKGTAPRRSRGKSPR